MKTLRIVLLFFSFGLSAQVGINTTAPSAQLDIRPTSQSAPSNTDGLLIPKIDAFPAVNPTSAQQGMLVYLTTTAAGNAPGFYYWDNTATTWTPIGGRNAWCTTGNSGMTDAVNFIGTTDNKPLNFKVNNDKAGRIDATLENTFFGYQSGKNTTGNLNTAFGNRALTANVNGIGNTAFGRRALNANVATNYNTAIGLEAMEMSTGSGLNTALGWRSLRNNLTGNENTALGVGAMENGTFPMRNVAVGRGAMIQSGTSTNNVAVGYYALQNQSFTNSGFSYSGNNTAVGSYALQTNNPTAPSNGVNNVAIGAMSMYSNTIGARNTAVGVSSLFYNTTGNQNTSLGTYSLSNNTLGNDNVAIGTNAAQNNTTGNVNIAIGNNALGAQSFNNGNATWAAYNLAIGYSALAANQPTNLNNGNFNCGIGHLALWSNSIGRDNVSLGVVSLYANLIGNQNVGLGNYAGYNYISGSHNTFLGHAAALGVSGNATGSRNTAIGWLSFYSGTSGSQNTAVGEQSLFNTSSGQHNVAIGSSTMAGNTTGSYNTAVGTSAGHAFGNAYTGNNNFYGGSSAGNQNTQGSNNTFLGANSNAIGTNLTYATAIGSEAYVGCSNCLALGGTTDQTRTNVGINTSYPIFPMEINEKNDGSVYGIGLGIRLGGRAWEISHAGDSNLWFSYDNSLQAYISSSGGTYNVSDRRLKKDIVALESVLDKVMQLKPSHYRFIRNNPEGKISLGFIAQEVLPLFPEVVDYQKIQDPKSELNDVYAVDYANMSVVAIKAIQEQQQEIEKLKNDLEAEKQKNAQLGSLLSNLEKRLEKLERGH